MGEPLRATIPVTNLTRDEAESLQANPASPDVFNAHGANYSAIMTQLKVKLQRRADGSAVLQLSTSAPVNEPFLDLVLNTTWNGGSAVRSYALLLDPPASTRAAPAVQTAQAGAVPSQTGALPAFEPAPVAASGQPSTSYQRAQEWMRSKGQVSSGSATSRRRASATIPAPVAAPVAAAPVATRTRAPAPMAQHTPSSARSGSVTTRRGDTAGAIARRNLPANVSLDQMLVALQRANPHAFIQGNVNLLRSGVTLEIPDAGEAQAVSAKEARRLISAQTRNFNQYRGRIAHRAPAARVAPQPKDTTSGQVTAPPVVAPAPQPDTLVLTQPKADAARKAEEDRIAAQRQREEDAARKKEAEDNASKIEEMQRLLDEANKQAATSSPAASGSGDGSASTAPGADSGVGISVEAQPPMPLPQEPTPAPADATGQSGMATTGSQEGAPDAQAPIVPPVEPAEPVAPPPPPPPPPPETSLLDDYMPYLPYLGGGLLALLLGYGFYRYRRNRGEGDVVYENSGNIPDSFFASGSKNDAGHADHEHADSAITKSGTTGMSTGVSSMSYSPSQIDATGEGDPVLEADVLLAYGRDQQAEEVLKEAEINNPTRAAIKVRLAEIYASRQDKVAFEAKANEIARLTQQSGADWVKVAEIGRTLDPGNALYQTAVAQTPLADPNAGADSSILSGFGPLSGLDFDFQSSSQSPATKQTGFDTDSRQGASSGVAPLSDLDLSLDSLNTSATTPLSVSDSAAAPLDLDFNAMPPATAPAADSSAAGLPSGPSTGLDAAPAAAVTTPATAPLLDLPTDLAPPGPVVKDSPPPSLDLDLSDLQFDAPPQTSAKEESMLADLDLQDGGAMADNPLATKLALAKEFSALGDNEGAQALAREVLEQADGELKEKAQALLKELG
ncbi:FimV/HubP family polar landmark protein [Vandammella animalimorsus]|uniref:FimV/HubP family polar landmark protein n=1 Tax=Vandammella animalimorsus TaxID=2029117 RepID=UPI001554096C|nr:FimV/HubP family polar landmark protein [Vandammella animalimorsus]